MEVDAATPPHKKYHLQTDDTNSPGTSEGSYASSQSQHHLLAERLCNEMAFEPTLAASYTESGLAARLLSLKDAGFCIGEGDPLLLVGVDTNSADSRAFFDGGNYALPMGSPGYLPWPGGAPVAFAAGALPAGVAAGQISKTLKLDLKFKPTRKR